jgi:hypothetical protein
LSIHPSYKFKSKLKERRDAILVQLEDMNKNRDILVCELVRIDKEIENEWRKGQGLD